MKNFKKVLALVLAVATLLSFATIAGAYTTSADYKDASTIASDKYTEAVDVLSAIGVLNGYGDGTFKPEQTITRAEAAKIIAMFDNGSTDISSLYTSANPFTDCKGLWAESYIAYGYKTGIIGGVGNNKFAPSANVTGIQYLKMVLVVLGYDAKVEGLEGTSWAVNTLALAKRIGLLANLPSNFDVAANLTRGQAAQIMLNALQTDTVKYGSTLGVSASLKDLQALEEDIYKYGKVTLNGIIYFTVAGAVDTGDMLAEQWKLDKVGFDDDFMRPGHEWLLKGKLINTYMDTPVAKYTTKTSACTMLVDLGIAKTSSTEVYADEYLNGTYADDYELYHDKYNDCGEETFTTGQGTLTEVYDMGYDAEDKVEDYRIVEIETCLAYVNSYSKATTTKQGHTTDANIDLDIWNDNTSNIPSYVYGYTTDKFAEGDMVLVTYSDKAVAIESIELAKSATATLNGFTTVSKTDPSTTKIDSTWTPDCAQFVYGYDASKTRSNEDSKFIFYYDIYGNVIGMEPYTASSTYCVIDSIYKVITTGKYSAIADLVTLDAKTLSAVKVTSIVSKTGAVDYLGGGWALNQESKYNALYYNKLFKFTVDSSNNYSLVEVWPGSTRVGPAANTRNSLTVLNNKDPNMLVYDFSQATAEQETIVKLTDTTQILVHENDGTYTSYTGYKGIGSDLMATGVEYVSNTNGYATVVYLYGTIMRESESITGYVADPIPVKSEYIDGMAVDIYTVYVDGVAKDIYFRTMNNNTDFTPFAPTMTGLYDITFTTVDGVLVANFEYEAKTAVTDPNYINKITALKDNTLTIEGRIKGIAINDSTKIYIDDDKVITAGKIDDITTGISGNGCYARIVYSNSTSIASAIYLLPGYVAN